MGEIYSICARSKSNYSFGVEFEVNLENLKEILLEQLMVDILII